MLAYADAETLRASSESSINSCSTIGPDAGDCKNGEAPSTSSRNTRIIFVDAANHDEVMAMDPRHTLFISMHWCVEMGGGKTFSTAEVRAACVVDPSSSTSRRGGDAGWHASVVLDVGRTLLSTCVEDTPLTRYLDCMTEFSRDVLPTISRQHAEMVLHLVGGDDDAAQVRCRGYDITDHVSATTFREVALHPHHRYPFQCHLSSSSSSSSSTKVNDHQDVVLELALGKRCRLVLTLHHAPHQRQRRINPKAERTPQKKSVVATKRPRATDAQPNTHADTSSSTSVSGTTRRRAAGRSRTRVIEMDATKTNTIDVPAPTTTTTTTSSTCSPTMKIFTTGISLTAADERRARALGLHINPSLQCASAAHILVVEAPLRRSIKLLSVLPFVDVVADVAWLRDVLRRKDVSINPRTYVYHEDGTTGRRSKLELANNFCLADFLQRSPSQRQELMSGLSIWIHPCTQPQQPPQNDIRSVVIASGGVVAMEASRASVVLMPSLQPTKHQWRTAISAGLCMTSSIIIITSDDLLRSVLQQKRIDASTVCAPTTFATD